jgi:hypothetical protein
MISPTFPHRFPAILLAAALSSVAAMANAQEPPRTFDLSCDAHSVDGVHNISTTLRFAVDLDTQSMRPYHDGKLQPSVPIKISDDRLVLRDDDQKSVSDYGDVHVIEMVDRRTGVFVSTMKFTKTDGGTEEARTEGQCAFARYTGADGKPLY